ncbi:MAG: LexA family transcriptional regulator [Thermodesulfobacteriota bacterium]
MRTQFGPFFERVRQATEIQNQSQLAKALGVGRAAISLVKHKNTVPPRWILLLSRAYDLDPVWLAGEDEEPETGLEQHETDNADCVTVPWVCNTLDTSTGKLQVLSQPAWPFSRAWLESGGDPESMVALHAPTPALEPTIHPGDTLLIDQSQRSPADGAICLLNLQKGVVLRRVWLQAEALLLQGGPSQDRITQAEIAILGRVVFSLRCHAPLTASEATHRPIPE